MKISHNYDGLHCPIGLASLNVWFRNIIYQYNRPKYSAVYNMCRLCDSWSTVCASHHHTGIALCLCVKSPPVFDAYSNQCIVRCIRLNSICIRWFRTKSAFISTDVCTFWGLGLDKCFNKCWDFNGGYIITKKACLVTSHINKPKQCF